LRNREAARYARWAAMTAGLIALVVAGVYAERAEVHMGLLWLKALTVRGDLRRPGATAALYPDQAPVVQGPR